MNLLIGSFRVPVAALNLFDTVIIMILVPIFDRFLYPFLASRIKLTMLKKIGSGFLLAIVSMVAAALLEIQRLKDAHSGDFAGTSPCVDDNPPPAANLTIFWQIPQFMLIGASEVLASITALEFFNKEAPNTMKSLCAALNLVTTALGQWVAAALIPIVNSDSSNQWITGDVNQGHLDWLYWLLSALMGADLLLFMYLSHDYQYRSEQVVGTVTIQTQENGAQPSDEDYEYH